MWLMTWILNCTWYFTVTYRLKRFGKDFCQHEVKVKLKGHIMEINIFNFVLSLEFPYSIFCAIIGVLLQYMYMFYFMTLKGLRSEFLSLRGHTRLILWAPIKLRESLGTGFSPELSCRVWTEANYHLLIQEFFFFWKCCGQNPPPQKKSLTHFKKIMVLRTGYNNVQDALKAPALTRNVTTVQLGVYLPEHL